MNLKTDRLFWTKLIENNKNNSCNKSLMKKLKALIKN